MAMVVVFAMTAVVAPSQSSSTSARSANPAPTPPGDPDAEVIRVETNLVNTFFTAVDRDHHFLTSLRAEDVSISEDGVVQKVSLFEHETERPLSLVLLIDTSDSQRGIIQDEKSAARVFVDSVVRPDRDHAAIVSFTGAPKVEQEPTNNLAKLQDAIQRVRIEISPENQRRIANGEDPLPKDQDPSGYTGIWDAMSTVIGNLLAKSPEGTRRAIVLLSDGDDTSSSVKRSDAINLAIKSDVAIYSIGMRDQNFSEGKLDSGALRKISDNTGGRAFFPQQVNELQTAFKQIELELRSQYLIAYTPSNKNHDGSYRRVRIDVVNPDLRKNKTQLVYREGYYAKKSF